MFELAKPVVMIIKREIPLLKSVANKGGCSGLITTCFGRYKTSSTRFCLHMCMFMHFFCSME